MASRISGSERVRRELTAYRRRAEARSSGEVDPAAQLEELHHAIAELRIAEDELSRQNEDLLATRQGQGGYVSPRLFADGSRLTPLAASSSTVC